MAYKYKGKHFLMKVQAVADTPEIPDGSNAIKTMELEYSVYKGDTQTLDYDENAQGAKPQINVRPTDEFSFKASAFASGVLGVEPPLGVPLRGCGMNVTVDAGVSITYSTIDVTQSDTEFMTCYHLRGNMRYQCSDAMGDFGFELKSGTFARFTFSNWQGKYIRPVVQAVAIVPSFTDWKDPLPSTKANTPVLTIGGWQGCVDQFTFGMGNNIVQHDRAGCAGVTITMRTPTAKMVIEAPDIATKNFFEEAESHSGTINLYDVVFQHGIVAGSIIGGLVQDCQISGVNEVDLDGKLGLELDLIPTHVNPLILTLT